MKKTAVSFLLILTVFMMGGCWDSHSIEDMDICTAAVVDYEKGEYSFTIEIVDIASKKNTGGEGNEGQKSAVIKGSGENFAQARADLDMALNKPIYLGAVQSLIMTEQMADRGIEEYVYRVRDLPDYRKTMDMIITPDTPMDVLNVKPENSSTVGFALEDTLQTLLEQGSTFHMSLTDVLQKLSSHNKCYLLSTLGIKNEQLALLGYTVFCGGQREGFIPYDETRGILYLIQLGQKMTPKFLYVVHVDQIDYTLSTSLKHANVKVTWDGEKASYSIGLDFSAILQNQSAAVQVTKPVKDAIQTELLNHLREDVTEAINTSLEYGCDYLSLSEPFRIKYPDVYERLDWAAAFIDADFTFHINAAIADNNAYDYIREG